MTQPVPAKTARTRAGDAGQLPPRAAVLRSNVLPYAYRINFLGNLISIPAYREVELRTGLSRPEFLILICLAHVNALNAKDITVVTGWPKNSISRAVHQLLGAKRIERMTDPEDRRHRILVMTREGRSVYERMLPILKKRETAMLAVLNQKDLAALDRILDKLIFREDNWTNLV